MNKFGKFIKKAFIVICVIALLATVVNVSIKYYQKVKLRELIAIVTDEEATIGADVINQIDIYLNDGKDIDSYEEHFLCAVKNAYNGEYLEAENSYLSAIECTNNDSDIALAYRMLGVMYCNTASYSKAVEYLEKSLEYEPENTRGLLYLSESYLQLGNFSKALKNVNTYADNNELNFSQIEAVITMYINIKEYGGAINQINQALEDYPDNKEELILYRLQANLLNDDYDSALKDAQEYIELTKLEVNDEIIIASFYYSLEMYEEALNIYLAHIENEEYDYISQAIECAYQIDDYDIMLELSKKALTIFKEDEVIEYYKWNAIALMQLNNFKEAISSFNTYIEAYPTHYEIVYLRALCSFAISDYEFAIQDFTTTIESGTLLEDSLYNRGLCYVQLNNLDDALADFKEVVSGESGTETYINALSILELLELEDISKEDA